MATTQQAALRLHLHARQLSVARRLEPSDERLKEIPIQYHSIYPLDPPAKSRTASGSYGYPSAIFKVISERDGVAYALRRMDSVRCTARIASAAQERWTTGCPPHPNLVRLERCFVDKNKSLFFVHSYWPTSQTLAERYVNSRQEVAENLLWSYLTQLSSALRVVHVSGLAVRCLSPAHVLVTSGSRVRIGGLGVVDVVEYDQVG